MRNTDAARFWILGMFWRWRACPQPPNPQRLNPPRPNPRDKQRPPAGAQAAAAQPTAPASPYAGSDTCAACHEDIAKAFAKSPHHMVETDKKRGFEGRACESCHGPGEAHAESADPTKIRNPAKLAAAAADRLCLTCHLNTPTHVGRLESSHAKDQVACTTCHKMHANGGADLVQRAPAAINQQCSGCHLSVWAQFQRPNHHKVPEGAMSCVDCHNPHGSIRPAMTQTFGANEPGCLNCHGDKRGPFTFEHGPVRFEGCATCHEPHGSANPRMLTRQDVRYRLSGVPRQSADGEHHRHHRRGAAVVSRSALPQFQNCTVCHQKIHGSYVDRDLLK